MKNWRFSTSSCKEFTVSFKEIFIGLLSACTIGSFGGLLASSSKQRIKGVFLNNNTCQDRPTLVNVNFNKSPSFPIIVSVNKCAGSCYTIGGPYTQVCVLKDF